VLSASLFVPIVAKAVVESIENSVNDITSSETSFFIIKISSVFYKYTVEVIKLLRIGGFLNCKFKHL
jgi:hypothetical protein